MPINLATELKPIDPDDAKYRQMLENLQGNILKGHGRDHTVNIFIEFRNDAALVRSSLKEVAASVITSALRQHKVTQRFNNFKLMGGLFGNIFLTARGYRSLGFAQADIDAAFTEPADTVSNTSSNFREGMKAHGDELNDPSPDQWENGFKEDRIDAMVLLADDDRAELHRRAGELIDHLETFSTVLTIEVGDALRNDNGEGIEHFGYADGRSQPIFFTSDLKNEGDISKWDPSSPLNLVLLPDKLANNHDQNDCFGSYFVFRKLEQNVRDFLIREQLLADELKLVGNDRERAGAMAVGRFRDGTPLVLSQTDGFIPVKENNFKYDVDPSALKCPFHAHIRKTNPRGDLAAKLHRPSDEDQLERRRRIARRGIPFGQRDRHPDAFQALDDLPTEGVGLLFMCFQASITNQFAFMQRTWVNNENFVNSGVGLDPLIGQKGAAAPTPQKWLKEYGKPGQTPTPFLFEGFIKMKGGEFFFAPSIPFFRSL